MYAHVTISKANMFDGWDQDQLAGVDIDASVSRYGELLTQQIETRYPGIDVTMEVTEAGGYITPVRSDNDNLVEDIRALEADLYCPSDQWLVFTDDPSRMAKIGCSSCFNETPARPMPQADEEWEELAREHQPDCEWVLTRAHTLPGIVTAKLGISTEQLNALYGGDEAVSDAIAAEIRQRFGISPDYSSTFADQLLEAGVITPAEATWLDHN